MIDTSLFIHPDDAKAIRAIENIPGASAICKKIMEYGFEKLFYGQNIASFIRLSPTQLPHIYKRLPPICEQLGIEEPEFYLEMSPFPNACTFGDTKKFIRVTSGLLETMKNDEIDSVIAHECGHILCRHTLYHNLATFLLQDSSRVLAEEISQTLMAALFYWQRKSELSCDRVAAVITSPNTVARVQARLSGGGLELTRGLNMQEWAAQADEYEQLYNERGIWNKYLQLMNTLALDHPFSAVRVREVLKWGSQPKYQEARQALNKRENHRCPTCGKPASSIKYCRFCGTKINP
ncbi:MAG: M48 family metalloprotease [Bacteroidaceae bacterium]|nr:M48 family metalloprotease [Bacteroidaceae bacterium]